MRVVLLLALLTACPGPAQVDTDLPLRIAGPELLHTPPEGPLPASRALILDVEANDPDGVDVVRVRYRQVGALAFEVLEASEQGDLWQAKIPADGVRPPGLEYYFEANDGSAYRAQSTLPAEGFDGPFSLDVLLDARAVPFFEDFEQASGQWALYDLGWSEASTGFAGSRWELTQARSHSGDWAASHGTGTGERVLKDYLVSPALDLSSVSTAQVTWWQHNRAPLGPEPVFKLFASRGSPDPAEGDFKLVSELPWVATDSWTRSQVVDLSPFAGDSQVYLAWFYKGSGIELQLDDVDVRELAADLQLVEAQGTRVDPGGSSSLSVTLENVSPVGTDGSVILDCTVPVGLGSCVGLDLGSIAGGAQATGDLLIQVDASQADNSLLPVSLSASDGSQSWSWQVDLLVGDPTVASVSLDTDYGLVQLSIGSGDPDAPDLEIPVVADLMGPGSFSWQVDLVDHTAAMPPRAASRWWLRADNSAPGALSSFSITYDGVQYLGSDLGPWVPGDARVYYLPSPARPTVTAMVSNPEPIEPGDLALVSLSLRNDGGDTTGLTRLSFSSADPDLSLPGATPIEVATDGWLANDTVSVDVLAQISASHDDASPVWLSVSLSDELDDVVFDVPLQVPWPVLRPTTVVIDDWQGGNNDQLLQAGETVMLGISLTNVGSLDTWGGVSCSVSQVGGAASASFPVDTDYWGFLGVGSTKSENDLQLVVDAGASGDQLELELLCSDDHASYIVPLSLELDRPPWRVVSVSPDPLDDVGDDYPFDLSWVRYRVVADSLQLEISSGVAPDPATLFVEMWGQSPGAPYDFYLLGSQSGNASLRGYTNFPPGWTTLATLTPSYPDANTVRFELSVAALDLVLNQLSVGFAAGFCPSSFYCDLYPDAWTTNPYSDSIDSAGWFTLDW